MRRLFRWSPFLILAAALGVCAAEPYEQAGGFTPRGTIDELVARRLKELNIAPAAPCSDAVFVRRLYLDAIGTLPTLDETRNFLNDSSPDKRDALVDRVLAREEFADYWSMKWCDLLRVKSEFPVNLWPNAVQAYHHWIRECIRTNMPYDRFVRELLTSSGSNFRVPPVNFYRAVQGKDAKSISQVVGLTLMGTRVSEWPEKQRAGFAAFFSQIGYKTTAEWKEEIVFFDPGQSNAQMSAVFPDGTAVTFEPDQDPREVFAGWLISQRNPWFARNIVNRIWSWLLGRGIIHEPDDIRQDNPPVNPALLAYLQHELAASKYDLKRIYALILKSATYQRSCIPASTNAIAEANFAFYPVRRLDAEVLIDAINQITGSTEKYSSPIPEPYSFIPETQHAVSLADASISSPFLDLFGRSARDTGLEAERNNMPTTSQRLHLLNSSHIQRKIEQSDKLRDLRRYGKGRPRDPVDALYLTILSRYPTLDELKTVRDYQRDTQKDRHVGLDLAWALMNTAEFQCRH